MSFAATDSHGHTLIFGFGTNDKYKKVSGILLFIIHFQIIGTGQVAMDFETGCTIVANLLNFGCHIFEAFIIF